MLRYKEHLCRAITILPTAQAIKTKKKKKAICSNMDGPTNCHTEWVQSVKEGQIPQYCLCVEEKALATQSSALAWKIPWAEEPGRMQSMGSLRVRHDWATSLSLFTFMHWRRKWQPTPVFLPGESQGRGSLVDCCLWGRTESYTTDQT